MRFIRYWLPVIVWMVIIFLFSSRQRVQISEQGAVNFIFFKSLHIIEYALLYVLSFRALKYTAGNGVQKHWYLGAFVITILYALSDELHQTMVPTREGHMRDVIIDGLGATIAWVYIDRLLPKAPKKLQHWVKKWQLA